MENATGRGAFDLVIDVGALAGTITATDFWFAPLLLRIILSLDAHAISFVVSQKASLPVRQESSRPNFQEGWP